MNARRFKSMINIGLVVAFFGVLLSFPFKDHYFIGGLLFAFCTAALIGGLADSFAVKAIFGQPLKIKWPHWLGTNIIARQKQRLIDELITMVQDELFSPQSIKEALKQNKITDILSQFLNSKTGQHTLEQLISGAIHETVKSKQLAVWLISFKRIVSQLSAQSKLSTQLVMIINYIFNNRLDDTIASFLIRMLQPLLKNEDIKRLLNELIQAAITKYEKDNRRRQVANQIAKINSEALTDKLVAIAQTWLFELTFETHPLRIKIKKTCLDFVNKVEQDEHFAASIDKSCNRVVDFVLNRLTAGKAIESWLEQLEQVIGNDELGEQQNVSKWTVAAVERVQQLAEKSNLATYNDAIQNWLIAFVQRNQNVIGKLVKEKLNQYSTEELIELVEDKAGRDLQYIRLNGTLVGGLIGTLLFLIQFAVGGVA